MENKLERIITKANSPITISNCSDGLVHMMYDICQKHDMTISHYIAHELDVIPMFNNNLILVENFQELHIWTRNDYLNKMMESNCKFIFVFNNSVFDEDVFDSALSNKMIHINLAEWMK